MAHLALKLNTYLILIYVFTTVHIERGDYEYVIFSDNSINSK